MAAETPFLALTDRVLHLGAMPNFAEFTPDQLEATAERASERFFARGTRLARRGRPVPAAWLVVEGELHASGAGLESEVIRPREGVGLVQLYSRSEEGLDIVASHDTHVLEWDRDAIHDAFDDDFAVYVHQVRFLARHVLEKRQRVAPGQYLAPGAMRPACPERGLDLVERIRLLSDSAFRGSSLDALADLASLLQEKRFAAGTRLWQAGDASGRVLLLLHGSVRCSLPDRDALFHCGTGYPLGNIESLARRPRWFDAVTETSCIALEGDVEVMLDVAEDHLDMAMSLLASMAMNLMGLRDADRGR